MVIYKKPAQYDQAQKIGCEVKVGEIVAHGYGFVAGPGVKQTGNRRFHATKKGWVKQVENRVYIVGENDPFILESGDLVIGKIEAYYADDIDPGWLVDLGGCKKGYLPRRKLWHLVKDAEEAVNYFKSNKWIILEVVSEGPLFYHVESTSPGMAHLPDEVIQLNYQQHARAAALGLILNRVNDAPVIVAANQRLLLTKGKADKETVFDILDHATEFTSKARQALYLEAVGYSQKDDE